MTTKLEEETWIKAVGSMVYFYLVEKTKKRASDDFQGLEVGQMPQAPSKEFNKAWQSIALELYYRFRSARTKRLFADAFTQTLCSVPQGKLQKHLEKIAAMMQSDTEWEELRDVVMLSLSAKSFRRESKSPEEVKS